MISLTAGRCLDIIRFLDLVQHRRPGGSAGEQWQQALRDLSYHVMKLDEQGDQDILEALLDGLRQELFCYQGETIALKVGLATRGLLDG